MPPEIMETLPILETPYAVPAEPTAIPTAPTSSVRAFLLYEKDESTPRCQRFDFENTLTGCAFVGEGGFQRTLGDSTMYRSPAAGVCVTRVCDSEGACYPCLFANEFDLTPSSLQGV